MEFVPNERESGKVFVNKLASAERQLDAAIRMYFMEEDELAIHVVASASYNVFSDLLRARGKEEAEWPAIYGILRAAQDFHFGILTRSGIERDWPPGALELIEGWAKIFHDNEDLNIDEVMFKADPEYFSAFWREMRSSYNFLKHADKDSASMLDIGRVNNEDLIFRTIGTSLHMNCKLTKEREFFCSYVWSTKFRERKPIRGLLLQYIFKKLGKPEIFTLARRNLCYSRVDDTIEPMPEELAKEATDDYLNWLEKDPEL